MPKPRHLLIVVIALTACVPPEGGLTEKDVAGFWTLVDGSVQGGDFPFAADHRVTLHLDAAGELGGTAACNSYSGSYDLVSSMFELGAEIAMTAMACQPDVALSEATYLTALRLIDSAALTDDGRLHLIGDDAELLFNPLTEVDLDALVGRWEIIELGRDAVISPADGGPFIEFTAEQTMTGSTGCRPLNGRFVLNGDEVLVTELSAPGECSADRAEQDGLIVEVLGDGFVPVFEGDALSLTSAGGASLLLDRP